MRKLSSTSPSLPAICSICELAPFQEKWSPFQSSSLNHHRIITIESALNPICTFAWEERGMCHAAGTWRFVSCFVCKGKQIWANLTILASSLLYIRMGKTVRDNTWMCTERNWRFQSFEIACAPRDNKAEKDLPSVPENSAPNVNLLCIAEDRGVQAGAGSLCKLALRVWDKEVRQHFGIRASWLHNDRERPFLQGKVDQWCSAVTHTQVDQLLGCQSINDLQLSCVTRLQVCQGTCAHTQIPERHDQGLWE